MTVPTAFPAERSVRRRGWREGEWFRLAGGGLWSIPTPVPLIRPLIGPTARVCLTTSFEINGRHDPRVMEHLKFMNEVPENGKAAVCLRMIRELLQVNYELDNRTALALIDDSPDHARILDRLLLGTSRRWTSLGLKCNRAFDTLAGLN